MGIEKKDAMGIIGTCIKTDCLMIYAYTPFRMGTLTIKKADEGLLTLIRRCKAFFLLRFLQTEFD
ncbi:Hypothetical protein ACI5QL_01938 [Bacillus velezensis]